MGIFDLPTGANPAKDTPVGKDEMGRTIYQTGYGAQYVMPDAPKTEARFPTNFAYEMTTPQERASIAANPPAPQAEPNILSGTGIVGTLGNFNQMLNPVEAIGQSMSASQQMLAPETAGWDRVTALGNMLSGVAGVTAPAAAAYKAAMPAATALMESLLGWSPLRQTVIDRASQPGPVPTMYSNPIAGDVGRPPVTFADAERAMQEAQSNFQVTRQDASQIFGAGSERVRYTDPQSSGTIEVLVRPDGSASVLELEVPEANRGQGIGQKLQEQVMKDFPIMGGQVSSKAAATTAYRLGRRPPGKPNATLEDVFAEIDDMSSVNMVSPRLENKINPKVLPAISKPIEVNPNSLIFRESQQNRMGNVKEMFPEGEGYYPVVSIFDNGERTILDGHNRAAVAMERGDVIPTVDITKSEYDALVSAGFDDMEISYAALSRAKQDEAASAINQQFSGADIWKRGAEAEGILDDLNASTQNSR
jgi:hypothetical protein